MTVPSPATLRKLLVKEVSLLFSKAPVVKAGKNGNASLPAVVVEGRRRRAEIRLLDALVSRGSAILPKALTHETQELIRAWAATGYADGFQLVERFEVRCAQEHDVVAAEASGDPKKILDALKRDYRRRVVERYGKAELRGVQTSHRVVQALDSVFVPLHLEPSPVFEEGQGGGLEQFLLGQRLPVAATLKKHRHSLIVGAPGSGKTTLVAFLATRSAQGRQLAEFGWAKGTLPFVLTVRGLRNERLTLASLAKHSECDPEVLRRAVEENRALFLIDGLDEAPEELRARLVESIGFGLSRRPELRMVVTSRPSGALGEIEKSLPGLQSFRIVDLQRNEANDFIDRWCLAAELSLRNDPAEAQKEAEKAANDLKHRLEESYSVQKIAVNPLLLNILCIVHRFLGQRIPEHRVTLYERCTDALLYEWDRAKFPEGSAVGELDAPAKRRLLMGVARKIHEAHAAEIEEKEVRKHFEAKLPDLGRPASDAQQVIREIRDRSGLLVERRPGFFAFSHLTFQEYFCALDFVDGKQVKQLVRHSQDRWWHEVIVLAAGLPGAVPGRVARALLAEKSGPATFLAAQCLETAPDTPLLVRERVEKALTQFVPPKSLEEVWDLINIGPVAAPILMRALNFGDLAEPANALGVLGTMDYAPAVPTLVRFVGDPRHANLFPGFTVGGIALQALANRAINLEVARHALGTAVGRATHEQLARVLEMFRSPWRLETIPDAARLVLEILEKALKAAGRERRPPTPARSTAAKPRNRRGSDRPGV